MIKSPKILIMDEATSALDTQSEQEVQKVIEQLSTSNKNLTIVIIAHRLSSIECADYLLHFENHSHLVSVKKGSAGYKKVLEQLERIQDQY